MLGAQPWFAAVCPHIGDPAPLAAHCSKSQRGAHDLAAALTVGAIDDNTLTQVHGRLNVSAEMSYERPSLQRSKNFLFARQSPLL